MLIDSLSRSATALIAFGPLFALLAFADGRRSTRRSAGYGLLVSIAGLALALVYGQIVASMTSLPPSRPDGIGQDVAFIWLIFAPALTAALAVYARDRRRAVVIGGGLTALAGLAIGNSSGMLDPAVGDPMLRTLLALAYVYALPFGAAIDLASGRGPNRPAVVIFAAAMVNAVLFAWLTGAFDPAAPMHPGFAGMFTAGFGAFGLLGVGAIVAALGFAFAKDRRPAIAGVAGGFGLAGLLLAFAGANGGAGIASFLATFLPLYGLSAAIVGGAFAAGARLRWVGGGALGLAAGLALLVVVAPAA